MTMPRNVRYGNRTGMTRTKVLRRYVEEEGLDAAAEERIVLRACTDYPSLRGWINTDFMRNRIRNLQGRKI